MNIKFKDVAKIIAPFLIGILVGPGTIWSCLHYRIDAQSSKQEMSESVISQSIQLIALYDEIVLLSNQFIGLQREYSEKPSLELTEKMYQADLKLGTLKAAFAVVEEHLAEMTNREARTLKLDFTPPAAIKDFIIN